MENGSHGSIACFLGGEEKQIYLDNQAVKDIEQRLGASIIAAFSGENEIKNLTLDKLAVIFRAALAAGGGKKINHDQALALLDIPKMGLMYYIKRASELVALVLEGESNPEGVDLDNPLAESPE